MTTAQQAQFEVDFANATNTTAECPKLFTEIVDVDLTESYLNSLIDPEAYIPTSGFEIFCINTGKSYVFYYNGSCNWITRQFTSLS